MLKKNQVNKITIFLFAIIFSFFNIYIYMAEKIESFYGADYGILIFNIIFLTILIYFVVQKVISSFFAGGGETKGCSWGESYKLNDAQYFTAVALFQFLSWIPVFLAYYPGLFAYDVMSQIPQKIGTYSTHHPLLHTLYLQFFYYIIGNRICKSFNIGIACATLVQMAIFSAMLSFTHSYLRRIKIHYKIRLIYIAVTSFSPFFFDAGNFYVKGYFFFGFCRNVYYFNLL